MGACTGDAARPFCELRDDTSPGATAERGVLAAFSSKSLGMKCRFVAAPENAPRHVTPALSPLRARLAKCRAGAILVHSALSKRRRGAPMRAPGKGAKRDGAPISPFPAFSPPSMCPPAKSSPGAPLFVGQTLAKCRQSDFLADFWRRGRPGGAGLTCLLSSTMFLPLERQRIRNAVARDFQEL